MQSHPRHPLTPHHHHHRRQHNLLGGLRRGPLALLPLLLLAPLPVGLGQGQALPGEAARRSSRPLPPRLRLSWQYLGGPCWGLCQASAPGWVHPRPRWRGLHGLGQQGCCGHVLEGLRGEASAVVVLLSRMPQPRCSQTCAQGAHGWSICRGRRTAAPPTWRF